MLETDIERYIKQTLEAKGFKVIKLVTPGTTNVMDRMILRPRYWPGPPFFLECKRTKNDELRAAQKAIALEWKARGCLILKPVHGMADAQERVSQLIAASADAYDLARDELRNDTASIPAK